LPSCFEVAEDKQTQTYLSLSVYYIPTYAQICGVNCAHVYNKNLLINMKGMNKKLLSVLYRENCYGTKYIFTVEDKWGNL